MGVEFCPADEDGVTLDQAFKKDSVAAFFFLNVLDESLFPLVWLCFVSWMYNSVCVVIYVHQYARVYDKTLIIFFFLSLSITDHDNTEWPPAHVHGLMFDFWEL